MAFINDLLDLFTETVTWNPLESRDAYGAPTYTEGVTANIDIPARLVRRTKMVRDKNGDEVVSTAHVWIGADCNVQPDDQIVLEDDSTPVILAVERSVDEHGNRTTKVYFR